MYFYRQKNDHKTKALKILKSPENFKNINVSSNVLSFKAAFNYHPSNDNLLEKTSFKMLEYICLLVYLETIDLVWTLWLLHVGTQSN
jgi:hypothetical protein